MQSEKGMKKLCLIFMMLVSPVCFAQDKGFERAKLYEPLIIDAAAKYRVDPRLLWVVGYLETRFQPHQISRAGARGLMQIMPATGARYGLRDPFSASASIDAAARYLSDLQEMFDHRLDQVLAAYNSGEGTVQAFQSGRTLVLSNGKVINARRIKSPVPPYRETVDYVRNGRLLFERLSAANYFEDLLLLPIKTDESAVVTVDLEDTPEEVEALKSGSVYVLEPSRPGSSSIYPR
jgi:soluble lytic murein transglycosylase-like protein